MNLVIFKVCSHNFQNIHELVYSVTLNKTLITLVTQKHEGSSADVNHNTLDVLGSVVHGGWWSLDYPHIIGHLIRVVKGCVPV